MSGPMQVQSNYVRIQLVLYFLVCDRQHGIMYAFPESLYPYLFTTPKESDSCLYPVLTEMFPLSAIPAIGPGVL